MIDFKDGVDRDIHSVFINDREFADSHDIDGRLVSCVIDKDLLQSANSAFEGVFVNVMTIHVATQDLDRVPVEGELLTVDGQLCLVRSVSNEMGMLAIDCEAHEQ